MRTDSTGLALLAKGGHARMRALDVWEMGNDAVMAGDGGDH
jgi:hypothetical protein